MKGTGLDYLTIRWIASQIQVLWLFPFDALL